MLASEQTNSSPVKKNSPFMETVQDKLKDIKNFSNWSAKEQMIAVGAVGVMVGALLPFVAVALPVAATGAIVALTLFFAYKAVEYTFKGLKWSAEKTVDGAKYTAGKVKDASVYTAEKAREGYYSVKEAVSSVGQATREGTSSALRAMGDGVQKFGRKMSNGGASMSSLDAIPYSIGNEGQTVVLKTEEKTRNFNSVKEMFIKEVLEDKAVNNSALTKEIFSKLGEKILEKAYSVDGQQSVKKDQLINRLKQQVDFVNKLDAKKLQNLLSDNNSLYEIFSEHHDKIKRIIGECKREYEFYQSVGRNNAKDAEERKASKSSSFSPVFSLGRKDSTQSTSSLSKSSSLDSVRTESTASSEAELLNPAEHKEVETTSSLRNKLSSLFKDGKKSEQTTEVKYQDLSEPDTSSRRVGESTFYVAPPKPPRSNSLNSIGTESTVTVSDSDSQDFVTVDPNRLRRSSSSSSLGGSSSKLTPVDPPKVPGIPSLNSLNDGIGAAMEKNLEEFSSSAKTESTQSSLSNRNGSDSGFNSPTSSPTHTMFTNEDGKAKTQADLKKTGYLNKLVGQPSTKVGENSVHHPASVKTK
ncbi:actin-bundling T4SS effector WalE1 family protein [Wolbachia endosymbiont (group A) of Barypeithes pellucidus]|uniref:actin-bundling T4SS effector WalE1 family protein n=1 Tax=Wolbachia endosymbiont (group A) of Barypeithes pellucidus TaxID=3139322 RepID=UPI003CCA7FFC